MSKETCVDCTTHNIEICGVAKQKLLDIQAAYLKKGKRRSLAQIVNIVLRGAK